MPLIYLLYKESVWQWNMMYYETFGNKLLENQIHIYFISPSNL